MSYDSQERNSHESAGPDAANEQEIDVRDCPECNNGTKGSYDGRVMIGGRGIFTCPVCKTRWQDENEKPSTKGMPVNLRRSV